MHRRSLALTLAFVAAFGWTTEAVRASVCPPAASGPVAADVHEGAAHHPESDPTPGHHDEGQPCPFNPMATGQGCTLIAAMPVSSAAPPPLTHALRGADFGPGPGHDRLLDSSVFRPPRT